MSQLKISPETRRNGAIGAALSLLAGLALWFLPPGNGLVRLSYDLPFAFAPGFDRDSAGALLMIEMDEPSYRALDQVYGQMWDRRLHARLVHRLTEGGCRMIVFDVFFADEGPKDADTALAAALKAHGNVVLAADRAVLEQSGVIGTRTIPPRSPFREAARGWGISRVEYDNDSSIRWHYPGTEHDPSLPWAAAAAVEAPATQDAGARSQPRWLRYYGPYGTLPRMSYATALEKEPAMFKDRIVFIGGRPQTRFAGEEVDEFRTPYTRWDGQHTSGMEIEATTFLNLVRGDWLERLALPWELLILLLTALGSGFVLVSVRPLAALGLAALGMLLLAIFAIVIVWQHHVWLAWMIPVVVQVPCALAWAVIADTRRLESEIQKVKTSQSEFARAVALTTPGASPFGGTAGPGGTRSVQAPEVPDHEMLCRIGEGGYGEVWLARDAIGTYHAVKVVYRSRFRQDAPFDREFRGVQKYTPYSRSHPGLVQILHVGRNQAQGCFYCVMELGDDEQSGQQIDPRHYSPKNLAREIRRRGALPLNEAVDLGLALTDALDFLHQRGLIHRDVKSSNIIFVNGVPKFADIGLVTNIASQTTDVSFVGTEGYFAPEGPGTPAADVYSLGKVLYEVCTGKDRGQFPELPTDLTQREDTAALLQFNAVIMKACRLEAGERYQTARAMHEALRDLAGNTAALRTQKPG